MRNAGPSEALPLIDEVREHICEFEGERRQLGVGAYLIEPEKLGARKRRSAIGRYVFAGRRSSLVIQPAIEVYGPGAPLRIGGHAENICGVSVN